MLALEVLHLEHSLPEICDVRDFEPISSLNLQRLCLISSKGLSSILSVPVGTFVFHNCTKPDDGFASSLSALVNPRNRHVENTRYTHLIDLCLFTGSSINTPQLSLQFSPSLLEEVMQSLPLQGLSSLSLCHPIPAYTLIESFGKCQHLGVIIFDQVGVVSWPTGWLS